MNEEQYSNDYDVFEDDLFTVDENGNEYHPTIGRWGKTVLHVLKGAFVIYSGAHNIQATITATGDNPIAVGSQIVGVLILEASITALYMAGMGGRITGKAQSAIAALFWLIGMALASMGIVADSRLHAGYELGNLLQWHLTTGLYIAPVVMILGCVLVVFTDPLLSQQILNSRDRASIRRDKVQAAVMAEKYNHASRKIIHNIRLGAQKQMAIEARKYYKSEEVQKVLKETAVDQLRRVMQEAGINVPNSPGLPAGNEKPSEPAGSNGATPAPPAEPRPPGIDARDVLSKIPYFDRESDDEKQLTREALNYLLDGKSAVDVINWLVPRWRTQGSLFVTSRVGQLANIIDDLQARQALRERMTTAGPTFRRRERARRPTNGRSGR